MITQDELPAVFKMALIALKNDFRGVAREIGIPEGELRKLRQDIKEVLGEEEENA
jgi:hypothetical protein